MPAPNRHLRLASFTNGVVMQDKQEQVNIYDEFLDNIPTNATDCDDIAELPVIEPQAKVRQITSGHRGQGRKPRQRQDTQSGRKDDKDRTPRLKSELRKWISEAAVGLNAEEAQFYGLADVLQQCQVYAYQAPGEKNLNLFELVDPIKQIVLPLDRESLQTRLMSLSRLLCGPAGSDLGQTLGAEGLLSIYDARECIAQIVALLNNANVHGCSARLLKNVQAIGFLDDDFPVFQRLPWLRPLNKTTVASGQIDWGFLGPIWRSVLERMGDYEQHSDQSNMFEVFVESLTVMFTQNKGSKVVPYIYGLADSGKTRLLNDLGSFLAESYLPDQNLQKITQDCHKANLEGKRLVHIDEAPKGELSEDFKAISGGAEFISGRALYSRPRSFPNTCMLWITSNNPPLLGRDEAAIRRFRVIQLGKLRPEELGIPIDRRRESMAADMPELLEIGLALLKNNGGGVRESNKELIEEQIEDENQVIDYEVGNCFEYAPGRITHVGAIRKWAQDRRHSVVRVEDCLKRLGEGQHRLVSKVRVRMANSRAWYWRNIGFKRTMEIGLTGTQSATIWEDEAGG